MTQVRRLLGTSCPVALRVSATPDVADPERAQAQQVQGSLWYLIPRVEYRFQGMRIAGYHILVPRIHLIYLVVVPGGPSRASCAMLPAATAASLLFCITAYCLRAVMWLASKLM